MENNGKRKEMREKRKNQILDVTQKLVLKEGFGANLMSEIAKECGISRQRLYSYYDNLNAILADLHDLCLERLAKFYTTKSIFGLNDDILGEKMPKFNFETNDDMLFLTAYEIYALKNETIKSDNNHENITSLYDLIKKGQENGKIRNDFSCEQLTYIVGQLFYTYYFKVMTMQNDSYGKLLTDKRVTKQIWKMIQSFLKDEN